MGIAELERLLDRQGWIDTADCRRHGVTSDAACTRVARRQWERLRRGLYVRPGADARTRTKALAAAAPTAPLAGRSAVWWHGLTPAAPAPLEVVTSVDRRLRATTTLAPRRTRHLCEACTATVRGVLVLRLERAVLEHAMSKRLWSDAEAFITGVVQQGRTNGPRLVQMAEHLGLRSARLAELLTHICRGSRSLPEIDFIRVVRRFRLPEPDRNVPLICDDGVTRYADLAYPEHGYYVEIDGRICHFAVEAWEADLSRMNEISIGCRLLPLRFTSRQLRREPAKAADQVRRALSVER